MMKQSEIIKAPFVIAVDITNKCNYRCLHCYNASGENNAVNDEMSDEQYVTLFKEIAAMRPQSVCFCGGEPLFKFDLACKCAEILYEGGVRGAGMVSNGYYLTKEKAEQLKKSHFDSIQISLDGSNKDSCCRLRQNPEAFDKAIQALRLLSEAGFRNNAIAFCPTKWNIKEFDEIVTLCKSLDVKEIRVQPLMIIGRGAINVDKIRPTNRQYVQLLRKIKYYDTYDEKIKMKWADPLDHLFRLQRFQYPIVSYLTVKSNGSLMLSPYLPLSVGNVKRHTLTEYYENGLAAGWDLDIAQKMIHEVTCINDMGITNGVRTWIDDDVEYDILEKRYNCETCNQ